jgi:hypothetical protein
VVVVVDLEIQVVHRRLRVIPSLVTPVSRHRIIIRVGIRSFTPRESFAKSIHSSKRILH